MYVPAGCAVGVDYGPIELYTYTYIHTRTHIHVDVIPLSLGIRTAGGTMSVLLKRNSGTPVSKSREFSTSKDNQRTVTVNAYEGERTLVKDNHFLGKFDLRGIPEGPRGSQKVMVTFTINEDGTCVGLERGLIVQEL